jgi:hypothetical protein
MDIRVRLELEKIKADADKELINQQSQISFLMNELRYTKKALKDLLALMASENDYGPGHLTDIKDKIFD